jgi:hypothetical protein
MSLISPLIIDISLGGTASTLFEWFICINPTITSSQLSINDYFVIRNSNIGYGITSLNNQGSILSIGSSFVDNIYQVYDVSLGTNVISSSIIIFDTVSFLSPSIIDTTRVVTVEENGILIVSEFSPIEVTVLIQSFNEIDLDILSAQSSHFGEYSWGKIQLTGRTKDEEYDAYTLNGVTGLTTSTILKRTNPLRPLNYIS